MTKKDYQLLASAISQIEPLEESEISIRWAIIQSIAWALQSDNPKFNIELFKKACEAK